MMIIYKHDGIFVVIIHLNSILSSTAKDPIIYNRPKIKRAKYAITLMGILKQSS